MTVITNEQIEKLEKANGHRWTKGNHDRIYFNATDMGLKVDYYKSGNISSASFDGEYVSNAEAGRVLGSKMYIEVSDGSIHTDFGRIESRIANSLAEKLNAILADVLEAEDEPPKVRKD